MPAERVPASGSGVSIAAAAVRDGMTVHSSLAPLGDVETIGAMLARNASRFASHAAYCERQDGRFEPVPWEVLLYRVDCFAAFLSSVGVVPGARVMTMSPNSGAMLVAELATMCIGAIFVPIFPGYSAEQARELITRTGPTVLLIPGREHLARIVLPPSVRALVTVERLTTDALTDITPGSLATQIVFDDAIARFAVGDLEARRVEFLRRAATFDPAEPCLMMFTSGTTGALKGVLLTHNCILSQRRALAAIWRVTPDDRFLSYLPWHHSFGGIFEKHTALYFGATLYIDDSRGKNFDLLLRNWLEVAPTVYFSVPQVYQQLVVHIQTCPEDEARIFHPGLRFVFTAAASLPSNIAEYFASKRLPVVEGWGLTETSPCCTLTDMAEPRSVPGMVGYPIPGVTIKIAEDSEILVRGPNVMRAYFENPDATARALSADGWFHTGDLGEFVGAGLKLVARMDRVFKMLNAEKVVPTVIENRLAGMNPFIRHVIVAGEGRRFLTAFIFPDYFRIAEMFGEERARAAKVVKDSFQATIRAFNAAHPVRYERIRAFSVINKELTIEAEELTPSMKVRVRNVLERARHYLEAVYEPSVDCDCRVLRQVVRLDGDDRRCFAGKEWTLDRCHECGSFIFDDTSGESGNATRGAQP